MSDTRTPEAQLAQDILDRVTEHPDQFDMSSWWCAGASLTIPTIDAGTEIHCGTTLCVAGWAGHLTGWTLTMKWLEYEGYDYEDDDDGRWLPLAVKDDQERDLVEVAMEALGLAKPDLFHTSNETARAALRQIAAGKSVDLGIYEVDRWPVC